MIGILLLLSRQLPTFLEQMSTVDQNEGAKHRSTRYYIGIWGFSKQFSLPEYRLKSLIRCADPNYLVGVYFFLSD